MPSNIATAQKRDQDFHKSDTFAQTNYIKHGYCFLHGTENTINLFSQDLKVEAKKSGARFFRFYIVL